ncbi:MAG: hypothetical protein Fur0035_05680 [Anaerolineales bacterium]
MYTYGLPGMSDNIFSPALRYMASSLTQTDELDGLRRLDARIVGAIYDRYFPEVFRFVRYRLNDETLAEDIASDTFVRLLEATQRGRGPDSNLRAWLLSTASHIITDHLRKSYRRPTEALSDEQPDLLENPSSAVEQNERGARLKTALKTLTEEQQNVIALRFGQGYSLEETARVLKKNINAIKQLQFRALAALNRQMGEKP